MFWEMDCLVSSAQVYPQSFSDSICQSLLLYSALHLSTSPGKRSCMHRRSLISNSGSIAHFLSCFCLPLNKKKKPHMINVNHIEAVHLPGGIIQPESWHPLMGVLEPCQMIYSDCAKQGWYCFVLFFVSSALDHFFKTLSLFFLNQMASIFDCQVLEDYDLS